MVGVEMIGVLEVVGQDRDGNSDRLGSGNAFGTIFLLVVNVNSGWNGLQVISGFAFKRRKVRKKGLQ